MLEGKAVTILLTGSTGFIGKHLRGAIPAEELVCVVRGTGGTGDFCINSLDSATNWEGAFGGINTVIHLAGLAHDKSFTANDFIEVNTKGTLHLASEAAAAGVKRFVFISTIGVNGTFTTDIPFTDSMDVSPQNAYAQSKLDAELGLRKIEKNTGLDVVIIRPPLVYGSNAPGNFGSLVKLIKNLSFLPFGLLNNKRSFVSVNNLVNFIHCCALHPRSGGETFTVSDEGSVSVRVFTNSIASGLGKSIVQLPIPIFLMKFGARLLGVTSKSEQIFGNLEVDSSKAQELLHWVPLETMEQAMGKLINNVEE
jgi:nucleoside-diphosphate-sugar epimerase